MAKFLAYRKKLSSAEDDFATDADIWLFAEDLLNFVFRNHAGFPIKPTGEESRKSAHKGFTNTVKFAVELTQIHLSDEIDAVFAEISKKDDVVEAYCKYVTHLRKVLRSGGFDGGQFIHYCVFVAFLGEKFYRTGLHDFHYQTFAAVRRGFKKSDMSNGGWNILESAADAIVSVAEPVEKPRRSVPSPDVEQSPLEPDVDPKYLDELLSNILSDNDCLSDSSSDSSIAKAPSPNLKGSVESLRLCKVSDDESEKVASEGLSSRNLISPRKRPARSSSTSSSTEILKLPTPKDDFLKYYTEKSIHLTDTNYGLDDFHNDIIDLQNLSKLSDPNESCSGHLNTSPEHLSPFDQVAKRNKTESENVDIHSERSNDTENSQKENEIPLDWSFSLPLEQVSKPNSEYRRLSVFSELSAKAQEPNSSESTASTSKSSDFPRFPSF